MDRWAGLGGWLRWCAHPLAGAVCRGHAQYSAFASSTPEVAVGKGAGGWERVGVGVWD